MSSSFPLAAVKVPEYILMEILARLPASSLLRFKCVSKLWSSLISSRNFTNLFFKFSSRRRERRLFAHWNCSQMLFSSSLCNLDSTPTLNLDLTFPCNNTITNTNENDRLWLVNGVRGLMCFRKYFTKEREIQIFNYTTGQVLRLPQVESNLFLESDDYDVWNYFGYDPLNDEYKVLNTNCSRYNELLRSETQVLVLGEGASWRNTKSLTFSPPPHRPRDDRGISINGVLYYGAQSHDERSVLMSFDFNSEEFNLIEFPMEYHIKLNNKEIREVDLIHYQDHVAVLDDSHLYNDSILNLWVLEDTGKSIWSQKVLVLPCCQIRESLELEDMDGLRIRGTCLKGKVTLSGRYVNRNNEGTYDFEDDESSNGTYDFEDDESSKGTYLFYDLENNRITKGFVIDLPWDCGIRLLRTDIWEDVESIMYLQV